MKVKVSQPLLQQALTFIQRAVSSKPQLPVLGGVLFKVDKTGCQILATDLYLGIKTTLPAQVEESGAVVVPGKQLRELVSVLEESEIEIETKDNNVEIRSGASITTLALLPLADFPDFPTVEGEEIILSKNICEQISQKILPATSSDATRPVLTCVLFSIDQKSTQVVATDGFRLSLFKSTEVRSKTPQNWLVPASALTEVIKISQTRPDSPVSVCVAPDIKQIRFSIADVQFWVRLMDGEYPPYQSIIPSEFKTTIQMVASELLSHVKRAQVVTKDTSNIVEIKIAEEKLSVSARSAALASYQSQPATKKIQGEDCSIAFNARYLIDILKDGGDDLIQLSLVESLKPAKLTYVDQPDFLYVMMPFRINN